jgi:hypothetical protein
MIFAVNNIYQSQFTVIYLPVLGRPLPQTLAEVVLYFTDYWVH